MRLERKRIGKEFNEVGENHTNLERQFAHNKSDLERKGIKEKSKKSMEINSLQNSIKDAEKKIRVVSEAVIHSIADIRDEISDDRIFMRTEIKQHADELRRQGIAYDRIHGRQSRCENEVTDVNQKCKQISRSLAEIDRSDSGKAEKIGSRATMTTNRDRNKSRDLGSEYSRLESSALLNYQVSMSEINTERISNNSSASFD